MPWYLTRNIYIRSIIIIYSLYVKPTYTRCTYVFIIRACNKFLSIIEFNYDYTSFYTFCISKSLWCFMFFNYRISTRLILWYFYLIFLDKTLDNFRHVFFNFNKFYFLILKYIYNSRYINISWMHCSPIKTITFTRSSQSDIYKICKYKT